jgi:hypothetical protein
MKRRRSPSLSPPRVPLSASPSPSPPREPPPGLYSCDSVPRPPPCTTPFAPDADDPNAIELWVSHTSSERPPDLATTLPHDLWQRICEQQHLLGPNVSQSVSVLMQQTCLGDMLPLPDLLAIIHSYARMQYPWRPGLCLDAMDEHTWRPARICSVQGWFVRLQWVGWLLPRWDSRAHVLLHARALKPLGSETKERWMGGQVRPRAWSPASLSLAGYWCHYCCVTLASPVPTNERGLCEICERHWQSGFGSDHCD